MRGKDEVRQTDIDWTFFHRPVTLRRRMRWGREGEVSETTSGEANFSSRFSRIILKKKKKNFQLKVFRRLVARIPSHFTWSGFERRDSRLSGPASESIWILAVSSNLYACRIENVPCVLLQTGHKAYWDLVQSTIVCHAAFFFSKFKIVNILQKN